MNVGLCDRKSFRFNIRLKQPMLSCAVVFYACFAEPLRDPLFSVIAMSDINSTCCHKRVFTEILNHSVVFIRISGSAISP